MEYQTMQYIKAFQSPPSVRKATCSDGVDFVKAQFQSPPSVRKATVRAVPFWKASWISIPAFRGEGDGGLQILRPGQLISILAFREEGDLWMLPLPSVLSNFNPRLP